jgi:hypothetical protein
MVEWLALGVAIVALGLNLWDKWRSWRPSLRVALTFADTGVYPGEPDHFVAPDPTAVLYVLNTGSRRVTPLYAAIEVERGRDHQILHDGLHEPIEPGEDRMFAIHAPDLARLHLGPLGPVRRAFVKDGSGRRYLGRPVRTESLSAWAIRIDQGADNPGARLVTQP